MIDLLKQPWPWYISGGLIGLIVPGLLLLGNKHFGISANFRHACAACFPGNVKFFNYDWKKEIWNMFFVAGILLGGVLAVLYLDAGHTAPISPKLVNELDTYGIQSKGLYPLEIFNWNSMTSLRGAIIVILGGFLIGFGSRYAGGCTSGHTIMGLSNLQLPSLIATISFFAGGLIMANVLLPLILKL